MDRLKRKTEKTNRSGVAVRYLIKGNWPTIVETLLDHRDLWGPVPFLENHAMLCSKILAFSQPVLKSYPYQRSPTFSQDMSSSGAHHTAPGNSNALWSAMQAQTRWPPALPTQEGQIRACDQGVTCPDLRRLPAASQTLGVTWRGLRHENGLGSSTAARKGDRAGCCPRAAVRLDFHLIWSWTEGQQSCSFLTGMAHFKMRQGTLILFQSA